MWSRTWCFNKTLLRKNLTRFWPLWVMASFLAALPPIMMAVELMRYRGTTSMNALYITEGYYSVLTYLIPPVLLIYAVVCAMAVWSYLFNSRSVGLMHTLPISRKGLFVTNFLSGFLMVLIPFVVCGALCVVVTAAFGLLDPVGLAVTVLCSLGLALFYFASATVCAFLTGNAFAMPAFYFVFHFLAVTLEMLLSNLANLCLFGVSGAYTGVVEWLSPTYWLNEHLHVERTWEEVARALPHGTVTDSVLTSVKLGNAWAIGAYALAGVVLLLCAWLLYRRRASECAGDVVAVKWMKPFFRYGVAALAALAGGQGLYFLFWYDWSAWSAAKLGACMFLAGVIGYYIASMLLAKSLRVFRGSWRGPVVVAAAAAIVCAGLRFDVLGVESRVPELSQIRTLELRLDSNTYTMTPAGQEELLEQVLDLHRALIADRVYIQDWQQQWRTAADSVEVDNNCVSTTVRYTYTLTDGTELSRWYSVPIDRERLTQPDTYDARIDALVNNTDMKYLRLHMDTSGTLTDGWSAQGLYLYGAVSNDMDGSSREAEMVLNALVEDIRAGNWGSADWFSDTWGSAYNITLEIDYSRPAQGGGDEGDYAHITLRPEMTNTMETLLELGLVLERDLITNAQWDRMENGYENAEVYDAAIYTAASSDTPRVQAISLSTLNFSGAPAGTLVTLGAARK